MDLFQTILVGILGILFAMLSIIGLKRREGGTMLCVVIALVLIVISANSFVSHKSTEWKETKLINIEEIYDGEYFVQGDNKYVYREKTTDIATVKLEDIKTGKYVEVEIKYLENQSDYPHLQSYTRWENYHKLTKYVFCIPKA